MGQDELTEESSVWEGLGGGVGCGGGSRPASRKGRPWSAASSHMTPPPAGLVQ